VPSGILDPRQTWGDRHVYDEAATVLLEKFRLNYMKYVNQSAQF